jgi:isopentenyldiphosphate isomerase
MSDELFDVVNERDEVTGQAPRARVHQLGLRHRAVHVLVFNARGDLFLQKRSATKDCFPGTWDSSAAGHLEVGESYDAAGLRELREELGWEARAGLERLFKIDACQETGWEFVWVYRCQAEGPFSLHPGEIAGGGWFSTQVLADWIASRPHDFASSFPLIWREMIRRGLMATNPAG